MILKTKKIAAALLSLVKVLSVILCAGVLIIVGTVLWMFEVKLCHWPVFVYGAPASVQVGDDVKSVGLLERLARQGYAEAAVAVPEPGEWSRSGSGLNVNAKYCPLRGQGIVSGPVEFTLDSSRIESIRLLRSFENVKRVLLEPELIHILPAPGCEAELCRPVPLEKVPSLLVDAVVLTEDPLFFEHFGIDTGSIFRAVETNYRARRYVQGGSTIPQQLMRMTLLSSDKTLWRKVNEVVLALAANAIYSKKTVLEAYLNRVYFGHWGSYPIKGIAEASRHLFAKDLFELDPAECALLAATIRAPNVINPFRHPERARSRRNMILGLLFKAGKIQREPYEEALESPVKMRKPGAAPVRATAFLDMVKDRLPGDLDGKGPAGSVRQDVLTSLDPFLQNRADLYLKHLGEPFLQAHLILANPQTGHIKALIAPVPQKWDGSGGHPESLLPLVIIPALTSDRQENAPYTLTSQVVSSAPASVGTFTVRQAFRDHRPLLLQRLIRSPGPERIVSVMKEFGIKASAKGEGEIVVGPVTPMEMAQSYCLLAGLGNAGTLEPGIRVLEGPAADASSERKRVSIKPSVLFLVNYVMKKPQPAAEAALGLARSWLQPSIFLARDNDGIWGVAFRSDAVALARMPKARFSDKEIEKMLLALLPPVSAESHNPSPNPEAIVFRQVCLLSGLRATSICEHVVYEPFLKGTQPTEWCTLRHEPIALRSGLQK